MEITEELKQYYLPYFKKVADLEKALLFNVSIFDQKKNLAFIKSAVEKHSTCSIQYTDKATWIISTDKYEIYFAILPTGDVVYYTVNKKTNRKGNYHRLMKLEAIYNHLIKLDVLDGSITFWQVLIDSVSADIMSELPSFQQQMSALVPDKSE